MHSITPSSSSSTSFPSSTVNLNSGNTPTPLASFDSTYLKINYFLRQQSTYAHSDSPRIVIPRSPHYINLVYIMSHPTPLTYLTNSVPCLHYFSEFATRPVLSANSNRLSCQHRPFAPNNSSLRHSTLAFTSQTTPSTHIEHPRRLNTSLSQSQFH